MRQEAADQARQLLRTDRLLGLDAVPLPPSTRPETTPSPAASSPKHLFGAAPLSPGPSDPQEKAEALAALAEEHAEECPHCSPLRDRLKMVFGEGDPDAALMFIGEGPGREEDRLGRPFVGPAGQLLNKQIQAMGLKREQVYIANIVKCRPPGNRVPTPQEADLCMPYLERQVQIIAPKVIVALGATAAKYLLNDPRLAITRVRGQWHTFRAVDLMLTFHPAYLLRSYTPENRRNVWEDLKKVMVRLEA